MKKEKRLLALLLVLILVAGMMPMQTQAAKKATVKKVTLNYKEYVLKKGETLRLKATITPKKAKVSWKSSNKKIATVNDKGVVRAKASKGKAVITAAAGKKKATCKVTIGTPVKKIAASNLNLTVGKTAKISAKISPKKATVKKLTYKSSKPSVATVNSKGKVTAKKAGITKITITAADRSKVKKVIKVTVADKKSSSSNSGKTPAPSTQNPGSTPTPSGPDSGSTPTPPAQDTPEFSISLGQSEMSLKIGEKKACNVTFDPISEVTDQDIIWSSTDDNVVAVVSAKGDLMGLTPGKATITAVSQQDKRVTASIEVTVSEEGVVLQEAASGQELNDILGGLQEDTDNVLVTLKTQESQVIIPKGTYENVTLIVDAPQASIDNSAQFKQVLIRQIAENTWCEKSGNKIFLDSAAGHLVVDSQGRPNVYLLDNTESVTIDNNGNLQELLIASAAKVLVKGDSVANPIKCEYYNGSDGYGKITTYVPLDIYSTTTYKLVVGPGGEQTAVKVSGENDIPEINGLGMISVTIDSTGENRTVIAENSDDLTDLPTTNITGKISKYEDETSETVEATVYLVRYSMAISNDNIAVYLDGSSTKKVDTDDAGHYIFESVCIGNYVIVVEAEGYQLITQNIYIDNNYNEDRTYEVNDIILMDEAGKAGTLTGSLIDASTGEHISKGLTVILRKGMNNITTNEVSRATSDLDGSYAFRDITPGQYTIQIRDESEEPEYVSAYENVSVQADATVTRNMALTKVLDSDEVRFVLTWDAEKEGVSADLDIHLYGPDPFENKEYDVYFSEQNSWSNSGYLMDGRHIWRFATLDVDDKAYEGPETITVNTLTAGQYKVFVQDYTNGGTGSQLYTSNPVIKIYKGSRLVDTVKMPQKEGGVWFVGSYNNSTGMFTVADEVYNGAPNTSVRAQIGTVLNQLTQFEVIDAAAFSQDQKLINEVTDNYLLKKTTEAQLTDYLANIQALLEKLQAGLAIEEIKLEGQVWEYGYFVSDHNMYSMLGSTDSPTGFDVVMKEAGASYELKKMSNDDYEYGSFSHRLVLQNKALGVSTNYYFNYYADVEYWVEDIQDPDNTGWKREVDYQDYGYTGGNNPEIGRNLDICLADGISISSIEYAADAEEGTWEYGERVDLVLHLKKDATGDSRDYMVYYKPLGAELIKITDTGNRIIEQERVDYYNWYDEDDIASYHVFGENKEMGDNWAAEVSAGASYELAQPEEYSDGDYDYGRKPEKVMTVTNTNGAKQVYFIYYDVDTSDAEIVGIYDPDNMYTRYDESYETYASSGVYYAIQLQGMNSELGKNLIVHTKAGASAKVEYATGSESWDYESSNAKITVTSKSGKERIYYIVYGKSDDSCNIRGISSNANDLKKVYLSDYSNNICITGSEAELGEDSSLSIKTNPGYTAVYSNSNDDDYDQEGTITVTEDATGNSQEYAVYYTQDISGVRVRDITSEQGKICSVNIANSLSTESQTNEKYYRINLVGETAECPADLQVAVPEGASATVTYADENWNYSSTYAAQILVTKETTSVMYLVSYRQDESGATVSGITDKEIVYLNTEISDYSSDMSLEAQEGEENAPDSEEVYMIYVKGNNKELGSSYQLAVPEGSKTSTIHKGESGWRYSSEYERNGYYDYDTRMWIYDDYYYADRVTVTAPNGAERIYLIAYAQDESGATVSGITDKDNAYVHTEISGYYTNMSLEAQEGEENAPDSEEVYVVYVKGNNKELGNSYELAVPEGSKTSTVHKGESGWRYISESRRNSYYDSDAGMQIYDDYYYADRVTVTAPNETERIYLIAYAQDESGATVSGITDKDNAYVHTEISGYYTNMSLEAQEGEENAPDSEKVYVVYVKGNNKELGNSYELAVPEGSKTSTIHKGESGWRYSSESGRHYYYDDESTYVYDDYYYADRVTVTAPNGTERVYLIAYAAKESETEQDN